MSHPYRTAFEQRDHAALVGLLRDDVRFHSPVIGSKPFVGKASVSALFEVVLGKVEDISYTHEFEQDGSRAFFFDARILGKPFKGVNLVEFDEADKVKEIWVLARPLTGIAAIAEAIGTGLGEKAGPPGPGAVRALSKPLAGMAAATDQLGGRLIERLNQKAS